MTAGSAIAGLVHGRKELRMTLKPIFMIASFCLVAGACTQTPVSENPPSGPPPGSNQGVGSQQDDWNAILKLEGEAKAIARISGCTTGECRAAPVGSKACGGPRYYIPYCSKTTDSVALYRKLDEVAAAEKAYNSKYKIASTCEFQMPPNVEVVGGSCVAK
jgi:hypothetical protein